MSAIERWVRLDEAGRLVLHSENDGITFLLRGAEATERVVSLEDLEGRYPRLHRQAIELLEKVEDLKWRSRDTRRKRRPG